PLRWGVRLDEVDVRVMHALGLDPDRRPGLGGVRGASLAALGRRVCHFAHVRSVAVLIKLAIFVARSVTSSTNPRSRFKASTKRDFQVCASAALASAFSAWSSSVCAAR